MKAEFTAENLYCNKGLMNYFMRDQAIKEFGNLVNKYGYYEVLDTIDNHYDNVDDMEEDLYNNTEEEMCEILDIEYVEDEEDKE